MGTARGGSPRARVAAYRVCFRPINGSECFDADVLAAFEAAIADGVHVISASVGGDATDYLLDAVAIGSLHAVKAGVAVVCSASNNGPDLGTVTNVAPWILTVAASSVDREFSAFAVFNHTRVEVRACKLLHCVRHAYTSYMPSGLSGHEPLGEMAERERLLLDHQRRRSHTSWQHAERRVS